MRSGCVRSKLRSQAHCRSPSVPRWRATSPPAHGAPAPGSVDSSSKPRSLAPMGSRTRWWYAAPYCAVIQWCSGRPWRWASGCSGAGWRTRAGAAPGGAPWRAAVRRFWCASVVFGAVVPSIASVPARVLPPPPPPPPPQQQGPGVRITYRVQLVEGSRVLASGEVSGPSDTRLRLGVRTDVVLVEALLSISSEGGIDSVSLSGDFFSRRLMGRSRRGLPLWEEDTYQRAARLAWGDTARILPFGGGGGGAGGPGGGDGMRLDLIPIRAATGGETRPTESVERGDSGVELTLEAVVRPRRVAVTLTLAREGATSVPRSYDLVP